MAQVISRIIKISDCRHYIKHNKNQSLNFMALFPNQPQVMTIYLEVDV